MKKLLLTITLAAFAVSAYAATDITAASFLNARSLVISNTISVTNLISGGGVGTNFMGTEWTNLFGVKTVVTPATASTTNDVTKYNLLNDVALPVDWAFRYGQTSNNVATSPFCAAVHLRLVGGSGANAAGSYVFQFLDKDKQPFSDRSFTFTITPNTTTEVNMMTNLTVSQLFGVSYIRPKYFLAGDTDASSQVTIKTAELLFWQP